MLLKLINSWTDSHPLNCWLHVQLMWSQYLQVLKYVCESFSRVRLFVTPWAVIDCSLSGSSVHRILQARIREWVAISFSRGSSWPRGQTRVSYISCIHRQILYCCTAGVALWCQLRQWFSVLIEPAAEVSSCFHVCCLGSRWPFQQYFLRTVFVSLVVYWLVEIGGREGGCQKKK